MVSVTQRINNVKQPWGGYLPVKKFEQIKLPIDKELNSDESISAGLIGIAVDYLTRFKIGEPLEEAFKISLAGARLLNGNEAKKAKQLLNNISGLDELSITSACKLAGYDTVVRAGPRTFQPIHTIEPEKETVENIYIMVNRSLDFIKQYGPIVISGFAIGSESRTKHITSGDGDFVTKDTIWDIKTSKNPPKKEHTLQLLIYYLMGVRSNHLRKNFENIKYLGIYNPRLQIIYRMPLSEISAETINTVEQEVIGY